MSATFDPKTWFAAIDARDFGMIRKLMAPGHSFSNPMTPQPANADQHIAMMQQMTGAFTGSHKLILTLTEENHVAVYGRWTCAHTGDFNGIKPTGHPVSFTFADFFEIVDGKVGHEAFEMNPMAIMAQIGAKAA
jgi:predicted ester cyclase